jgi:glycosyltransferase involved in cell wall biosynthesis
MKPKLSILTPTIPSRQNQVTALQAKIAAQGGNIEHLILSDNRARTIGEKRQALLDIAQGDYFAFVDDDDDISDDYVASLLVAIGSGADVVTFQQRAIYNGKESTVVFRLGQGDHPFIPDGETLRDAWHVCAWRRSLVGRCLFPATNYGEDRIWALQARQMAKTSCHIDAIVHTYRHDAGTTAAPEPPN